MKMESESLLALNEGTEKLSEGVRLAFEEGKPADHVAEAVVNRFHHVLGEIVVAQDPEQVTSEYMAHLHAFHLNATYFSEFLQAARLRGELVKHLLGHDDAGTESE